MCRRRGGRKKKERKGRKGHTFVGEGCLKSEATKLKGIPSGCRTAGDKLSSKTRNFGIAPVCMPFEPFIVWDSLGPVPLFNFFADEGVWSRL